MKGGINSSSLSFVEPVKPDRCIADEGPRSSRLTSPCLRAVVESRHPLSMASTQSKGIEAKSIGERGLLCSRHGT